MPQGIGSVNGVVSQNGSAPLFPTAIVGVAVPPGGTSRGLMVLASDALPPAAESVSGPLPVRGEAMPV